MTSKLERIKRKLADEYMEACPGVTRQEAKRRMEPRARMMLTVVQINVSAAACAKLMREELAPAFRRVAGSMAVLGSAYRGGDE